MKLKVIILSVLLTTVFYQALAQRKLTPDEYIKLYKDAAVADMKKTGVPASITLAQGMFESDNGNSPLAVATNNHFGIKCHKEWDGPRYFHDDDKKGECFRKYKNVQDSYDDHSYFLKSRERYANLFLLPITDYKNWAYGLKKAGYATNPQYPQRIIKLIEDYKLYELDRCKDGPCGEYLADITEKHTNKESAASVNPKGNRASTINTKKTNFKTIDIEAHAGVTNEVQYIVARQGDTYLTIAQEHDLGLWQIFKYNEIDKNTPLAAGQRLYIQHKKRKAEQPYHIVQNGETVHDIAQLYAIKSKRIYKFNKIWLKKGQEPRPGDKLLLRKA